jgi:hypothetical protein
MVIYCLILFSCEDPQSSVFFLLLWASLIDHLSLKRKYYNLSFRLLQEQCETRGVFNEVTKLTSSLVLKRNNKPSWVVTIG